MKSKEVITGIDKNRVKGIDPKISLSVNQ